MISADANQRIAKLCFKIKTCKFYYKVETLSKQTLAAFRVERGVVIICTNFGDDKLKFGG